LEAWSCVGPSPAVGVLDPGENSSSVGAGDDGGYVAHLLGGVAFWSQGLGARGSCGLCYTALSARMVEAEAAASDGGATSRRRPRIAMSLWPHGVGLWLGMVWVTTWCRTGGEVVDPVIVSLPARHDLHVGAAAPDVGVAAVVCERMSGVAWAAGRSGRAALRLLSSWGCRGGGLGRRCWWCVLGTSERWMPGWRPRVAAVLEVSVLWMALGS
jgi:hypothetical protein